MGFVVVIATAEFVLVVRLGARAVVGSEVVGIITMAMGHLWWTLLIMYADRARDYCQFGRILKNQCFIRYLLRFLINFGDKSYDVNSIYIQAWFGRTCHSM